MSSDQIWMAQELADCRFGDKRRDQRFRILLGQLSQRLGDSLPFACQDWANTKAAYRFLSHDQVSEEGILAGHFRATQERFAATAEETVLVLHDTTEFAYHRQKAEAVGILHRTAVGRVGDQRPRHYVGCGIQMHSSLAVTTAGLPLGLAAVKFWTRKKFKGCNALKKRINPTRVPIEEKESFRWLQNLRQATALLAEPQRCVHIGDRESDIYELFCAAQQAGTHFLVRTCVDRLAGNGDHTVADEMRQEPVQAIHRLPVQDKQGNCSEAMVEIRFRRVQVLPPAAKQKQYPELTLTVIYAQERESPIGREKINWKLLTDLPVMSEAAALEKLNWYAMRWKIEMFHKIMKSGCQAEQAKLRTAQRLVNLIACFCILAWRIFWMTMMNRTDPEASPEIALTDTEIHLLDQLVEDNKQLSPAPQKLTTYLRKLAKLGGYLARAGDPPPGNMVIWRGLSRLVDIELGFLLGAQLVGN